MKKRKIILILIILIIGIIALDTIQARVFKHSPLISWKEKEEDIDSWVDRGILMDTFYCTHEQDIVTVYWKFKNSNFYCPIDNIEYNPLINYELDMLVNENVNVLEKVFIFEKDNRKFYYKNEKYTLYIKSFDDTMDSDIYTKYTLKETIQREMITFEDILSKANNFDTYKDGGSKIYYYDNFNILVCNSLTGNNDIIIGGKDINANLCK